MMRVVLFSPTGKSLYARMVLHLLAQEPGVEVAGVVIRGIWSWRRLRGDLRRDGPRLMRKIYAKLVLGERAYAPQDTDSLVWHLREAGLEGQSLKRICRARGIACISVRDLNSAKVETFLKARETDLVVFTGGGLIRRKILALPRLGVMNCHAGILPRYRGMDVVEWAILEAQAEPETGLTLHFMDPGVDTGPAWAQGWPPPAHHAGTRGWASVLRDPPAAPLRRRASPCSNPGVLDAERPAVHLGARGWVL